MTKAAFIAELRKSTDGLPELVKTLEAVHEDKFRVDERLDFRTLDHGRALVSGLTALAQRSGQIGAAFGDPDLAELMARQRAAVARAAGSDMRARTVSVGQMGEVDL